MVLYSGLVFVVFVLSSEQMCETVVKESENGCRVIERYVKLVHCGDCVFLGLEFMYSFRFLRLLQVVVQEQGRAFKGFLPNIIAFCMEQIHPLVAHVTLPGVVCIVVFFE